MKADTAISITVNGTSQEVAAGTTLETLAQQLELNPAAVIAEHNGIALHRGQWDAQPLSPGDRIEFIRIVAGG
jgi:sulfur carrier protein